jgi:osmotically-inducible protein OsmY
MRKFSGLILICGFLLTGCPAHNQALINLPPVGFDRRSPDTIATDFTIEQKAREELYDDQEIMAQSHVNVNAYNGLALVTGETSSAELKNRILDIVRVIRGVKMVRDNLNIDLLSDPNARSYDAQLTEQVKAALTQIQTLPDFNSTMIKVVTENGVVYLMGLVSREEGSVVVNVTRLQAGVKQIVTVFEYTN